MTPERRRRDWSTIAAVVSMGVLLIGSVWTLGVKLIATDTRISVTVVQLQDFFARVENHICDVDARVKISTEAACHADFHPRPPGAEGVDP